MHELGVVFHIINNVENIAKQNNVKKVAQVTLDIGEVSTIVKDQFEDCWKWAIKRSSVLDKCQLVIETIPAITYCENCQKTYPTVQHGKICPYCESPRTYLLQGNEVAIKNIGVLDDGFGKADEQAGDAKESDGNPMPMAEEPPQDKEQ